MSVKAALAMHLKNDYGVVVKNSVGVHVYRGLAPPNAPLPRIVLLALGGDPARHMTAVSGLVQMDFQIQCWADNEVDADNLADAVRLALDHFRGTLGLAPHTVDARAVFLGRPIDNVIAATDGSGRGRFAAFIPATIWYKETIPTFV
jgi:hypothetical protein